MEELKENWQQFAANGVCFQHVTAYDRVDNIIDA
jgi:hypothetical protein